jgi:hypothetical protein
MMARGIAAYSDVENAANDAGCVTEMIGAGRRIFCYGPSKAANGGTALSLTAFVTT